MERLDFLPMKILAVIVALLLISAPSWGQGPELIGIGLSGSPDSYDTTAMNGRPIYVIGLCTMGPDTEFFGVCIGQSSGLVIVRYYDALRPDTLWIGFASLEVPLGEIIHSSVADTTRFWFSITLPARIPDDTQSLQLQLGVVGMITSSGDFVYGTMKTSHARVAGFEPCLNPVDENHETFLRVEFDRATEPPVLVRPYPGRRIGQTIEVQYQQPENALPGSLRLIFQRTSGVEDPGAPHEVYLTDASAGANKLVWLDGVHLSRSAGVDSVRGGDSLVHSTQYELELSYQDAFANPAASDTVADLIFDILTEPPVFVDPASGGVSDGESLQVSYRLPEKASEVILTFTRTAGAEDPASPHVLTLWEGGLEAGETFFRLSGFDLGTSNPHIARNPVGEYDSLVYAAAYRVTFSYQDSLANPVVEVVHTGFAFDMDAVTVPPILHLPRSRTADNASFTLKFTLPETPAVGSVWARFTEIAQGTAKWKVLVFGTLAALGTYTFTLNGEDLLSSPYVTDLHFSPGDTNYNRLLDGRHYTIYMSYCDAAGHDSSFSNVADTVKYDNTTAAPTITQPSGPVVFGNSNFIVNYRIMETPLKGSPRLVFTQSAGIITDFNSPHRLYPSDDSAAGVKSVTINAINLAGSSGIDSLSPGNMLVPNSVYTLSVEYQDTLGNPFASVSQAGLTYATGARIWARGRIPPGSAVVIPQALDVPLFRLSLRSEAAMGILHGVTFDIAGTAIAGDFGSNSIKLWLSQDSTFLAASDVLLDTVAQWGASVVFSGFSSPIDSIERHYFFTVSFDSVADPTHQFSVNILASSSINCAGDPVAAEYWPLVREDLAVEVEVMSFEARTDSLFGTLLLVWRVASERDNDGFNIWRSQAPDTGFSIVANYLDEPSLEGIGDHSYTYCYQWLDQGVEIGETYTYRLEIVSLTGTHAFFESTASGSPSAPPASYVLFQNRPNPFNATTTIEYIVPRSSRVWLAIYDILGRRVRTLEDGRVHRAAIYQVAWDGRNDTGGLVASGIYFCQLRGEEGFQKARKMLFMR
ncbi:MAG: hypothetical protein V1784_09255 [bacterium]